MIKLYSGVLKLLIETPHKIRFRMWGGKSDQNYYE